MGSSPEFPGPAARIARSVEDLHRLVGRPGLDPGTLGFEIPSPLRSTVIQIRWSEPDDRPPRTAEDLQSLLLGLQSWLQEHVGGVTGIIVATGADGEVFELRLP